MKNIYKIAVFAIVSLYCFSEAIAQKTLRLDVTNVKTNKSTDCDGGLGGDSDFEWRWFHPNGNDCAYFGGNNGPINSNPSVDLYNRTFSSADCWPSGAFNVTTRVAENDELTGNCNAGSYCSTTNNGSFPASTISSNITHTNNQAITCNAGCDPPYGGASNLVYRHTVVWKRTGDFSANNLNASNLITNKTCGTAININGGNRTNDANCKDVWYRYDLGSNVGSLTFNGANGTVTVYKSETSSCSDLCNVGSAGGGVTVNQATSGRYYIRVSANGDGSETNISRSTGGSLNNDFIWNADNMGQINAGGVLTRNATNNIGSSAESGEPNQNTADSDNETDWFIFTTGANVPSRVRVFVEDNNSNGDDLDADYHLYKKNDNGYTFPRCGVNWSKLTSIGDGDGGNDVDNFCVDVGTYDSDGWWCVDPNSTYYIQVRGYRNDNLSGCDQDEGVFNVRVEGSSVAAGPDAICDAKLLGGAELTQGESVNNTQESNFCATRQSGEPNSAIKNTVWYKFVTPSDGLVKVDVHLGEQGDGFDNPAVAAYRSSGGCTFGSLTQVGSDIPGLGTDANSDFSINCLDGSTTYYIQVGYNDRTLDDGAPGTFDLDISAYGYEAGPDDICDAVSIGTINGTSGSLSINNQSNECAGTESGEPGGGQNTVWYTFTTGATVGRIIDVTMDAKTNGLNADIYLYEACGSACSGGSPNFGVLNQLDNSFSVDPIGEGDATASVEGVIRPNTTYYVRADGVPTFGTTGGFDIDISFSGGGYTANDDWCNAANLGTIAAGGTINANSNSNQNAGQEEYCSINEPEAEAGDDNDRTIWHKITTDANPSTTIDISGDVNGNSGGGGLLCVGANTSVFVRAYKIASGQSIACPSDFDGNSNPFSKLQEITLNNIPLLPGFNYDRRIECPEPNTDYYIQTKANYFLGANECEYITNYDIDIVQDNYYKNNDDLCDAYNLGTLTNGATINAATVAGKNFTTFCSSKQTNEPNVDHSEPVADEEGSVWFKFTVDPAGIGAKVDIEALDVDEEAITEFTSVYLYEDPANCATLNDLIELDNKEDESYYTDDDLVDDCVGQVAGDLNPKTRTYGCLEPGKTYYIQIVVKELPLDAGFTDERAHFNLTVKNSRPVPNTNDNFVDAKAIGTIANSTAPQNMSYPAITTLTEENNLCADVEAFETPTAQVPELDHTVWYSFVAPASGSVQFKVVNSVTSSDPELDIEEQITVFDYTGGAIPTSSDFTNLMEYNADDDGPFGEDGEITWDDYVFVTCLTPGNTYYARVDGAYDNLTGYCPGDAMRGVFDLHARDYDIWESSDLVCNAKDITSTSNITSGELSTWQGCGTEITIDLDYLSNYCADNLNEIINPWDDAPEHTVWYSFEAPGTGMVTIEGINKYNCSNPTQAGKRPYIDIRLAVYDILDGFTCSNMSSNPASFELKGESESDGILDINCIGLDEDLEIDCLIPGRTYYIVVDGKSRTGNPDGSFGEFKLELTNTIKNLLGFNVRDLESPAPNDTICGAIDLGDPGNASGGVDTDVDDTTYPSPARTCRRAENTYCAGTFDDPSINGFSLWTTDNTVWYTFTAPPSGAVEIEIEGNVGGGLSDQLSPQMAVFETSNQANPCKGQLYDIFVGPAVSSGFGTNYNTGVINCLEPGFTYFIMVDGGPYAGDLFDLDGTFEVTVTEETPTENPPSHDDICDAKVINPFTSFGGGAPVHLYPGLTSGDTNRCASREFNIPEPSTFTRDRTVWYKFTTPSNTAGSNGNGTYAIDISVTTGLPWPFGDAMDPQIAIYRSRDNALGSCTDSIIEFYSDYDVLNIPFTESLNVQCLEPAHTYWIMVDGSTLNPQGYFDIEVEEDLNPLPIAANDSICDNINMGTLGATAGNSLGGSSPLYNNFCSGIEPGEPDANWLFVNPIDQTVWFSFTTPNVANNVNIDIELESHSSDNVDLQMALYQSSDGTCSGTLGEVETEYDPTLLFCLDGLCDETLDDLCLAPNTTYFLQVDGSFLNRQGYFTIEVINDGLVAGPSNDNFCNAKQIVINPATGIGRLDGEDNLCATSESGEPFTSNIVVAGQPKRTVWYWFIAPPSGRVIITTEDADDCGTVPIIGTPWPSGICGIDPHWALYDFDGNCMGGNFTGTFDELENAYIPTLTINPDDEDDYLCLFPGDTFYIQVDGTFLGVEGEFNIVVRDSIPNYSATKEPASNDCIDAIDITSTIGNQSCRWDDGTYQGGYNYGEATRTYRDIVAGCGTDCGDTWYKFTMPPLDPNCPGDLSFVKVEGNDELGLLGVNNSDLTVIAYKDDGGCNNLTYITCSVNSQESIANDVDFSIAAKPGDVIYLQVFSNDPDKDNGDDSDDFELCLSQRFSPDECDDATQDTMDYGAEYCWDLRDATGEDIAGGDEGYNLGGVPGDNTDNSVYYQFTTDGFCWGYEVIIRIDDPKGLSEDGDCNNPGTAFESPSGVMQYTLFKDGTPCNATFDTRVDFEEIDDCMSQYQTTVEWRNTYYMKMDTSVALQGDTIHPNSTYMIQLESDNRDIMDGTIEVRKLCDGREWAYATGDTTVSDGYCWDGEWRHYYNENETPADPTDDILLFSVRPNGNAFDGVATVYLANAPYTAGGGGGEKSWVTRRLWDFDVTGGSVSGGVDIRFYYLDSEKNEVISAATAYSATHGLSYEPFEWFKSANGVDFDPAIHITPRYILAQYASNIGGPSSSFDALNAVDHDANPENEWCNGVQYLEISGLTGFSGGGGGGGAGPPPCPTCPPNSPLPVELIEFTGYHDDNRFVNVLNWATASELNNDYFIIERSVDGINFVPIGSVDGAGTTNELSTYSFDDEGPALGINYYRLKQVDFDGTSEYSDIISIEVNAELSQTRIINYYPNPATDKLTIEMEVAKDGIFDLLIVDITGKVIKEGELELIQHKGHLIDLDVSNYASGAYIVNLIDKDAGTRHQIKFVKD